MELSRRGFLSGIIAAGVAPAFVRPGLIMPIKPALVATAAPLWILDNQVAYVSQRWVVVPWRYTEAGRVIALEPIDLMPVSA